MKGRRKGRDVYRVVGDVWSKRVRLRKVENLNSGAVPPIGSRGRRLLSGDWLATAKGERSRAGVAEMCAATPGRRRVHVCPNRYPCARGCQSTPAVSSVQSWKLSSVFDDYTRASIVFYLTPIERNLADRSTLFIVLFSRDRPDPETICLVREETCPGASFGYRRSVYEGGLIVD